MTPVLKRYLLLAVLVYSSGCIFEHSRNRIGTVSRKITITYGYESKTADQGEMVFHTESVSFTRGDQFVNYLKAHNVRKVDLNCLTLMKEDEFTKIYRLFGSAHITIDKQTVVTGW